jgi:SNF2 family DNA or RNA helicase
MLQIYKPHPYQTIADHFIKERDFCALFLDMGLGKTIIVLTAIKYFFDICDLDKPLIIAPKFVTEHTWPAELAKWEHLQGLTISVIAGTEIERKSAFYRKADIYIVSRDNIAWLVNWLKAIKRRWPFDMLVLDELSSFKNHKAKRFKAVRDIRPLVGRVIGLTGTPTPNGLIDLWAQMYLIDQGASLFKLIGTYREQFFKTIPQGDRRVSYDLRVGKDEPIYERLKPRVLSMKAEDWLTLPDRTDIVIEVTLDDYSEYKEFKKEKILETPEKQITAFNSSALYMKLLQYSNGAVYDDEHNYHVVHDAKLDALVEAAELLEGKPLLIFYQFQSDVDRIQKRIKGVSLFKSAKDVDRWNRKEINILLVHEASVAFGLNLQDGGNWIFWFGVTNKMELYWQCVKRLHRQGQLSKVFNYHFITKGTPEKGVYSSLQNKTLTQDKLMIALK